MAKTKFEFRPTKALDEAASRCLAFGEILETEMKQLLAHGYVRYGPTPKDEYVLTLAGRTHIKDKFPAEFAIANDRWNKEFNAELVAARKEREKLQLKKRRAKQCHQQ